MNSNLSYCPETLNSGQNRQFLSRATLKLDGRLWKTIGHLFYAASTFVHHFTAISEFKLELLSGNAKCASKWMIFCLARPCNNLEKTVGHLLYATSSFVHRFKAIGDFKLELQFGNAHYGSGSTIFEPCDLEIWRMTFEINRAPLFSNTKRCASFHHNMLIQTGVIIRKRLSWVLTSVSLTFYLWHWPRWAPEGR